MRNLIEKFFCTENILQSDKIPGYMSKLEEYIWQYVQAIRIYLAIMITQLCVQGFIGTSRWCWPITALLSIKAGMQASAADQSIIPRYWDNLPSRLGQLLIDRGPQLSWVPPDERITIVENDRTSSALSKMITLSQYILFSNTYFVFFSKYGMINIQLQYKKMQIYWEILLKNV